MSEAFNPVDGRRIVYQEVGEGEPLVLVHGSALSRAIWRGFGYVTAFRGQYRLVLVDLRGHGLSDKPHHQQDYRMPLVIADLIAVLDAAEVASAHYFGYSFGARVGFSLAAGHPDRLRSFISAGGTYRAPAGTVAELFFDGYDESLDGPTMQRFVDDWQKAGGFTLDPATRTAFLANDPAAIRAYFRQVEAERGLDETVLASIQTPTLLLAGTGDRSRYLDSERAAAVMPRAEFHALPGRNHATTLRPAEGVVEVVSEFLTHHHDNT